MIQHIRVAILDDHQSIIDGYLYRLNNDPVIEVVATSLFGEDLEPILAGEPVDVLLLDVNVPTSRDNPNPYPVLHLIPELLQRYPNLNVLVISMHDQRTLIKAVVKAGASGYILKDDQNSIKELGAIVRSVAYGGIYFSKQAHEKILVPDINNSLLTPRQQEILSIIAAYPEITAAQIAIELNVANSTVRNHLSSAYLRLGVQNRAAAIAKARHLGLITPPLPSI